MGTELQIALIAAGGAAVAAVWGYNLWQERQHKKAAETIFKGSQPDVLLQGQGTENRIEPSAATLATPERVEPAFSADARTMAPTSPPAIWVDDVADGAIRIEFDERVSAPALWSVQAAWAEGLTKPLSWVGYDADAGEWRMLSAHDARSYATIVVALQLADRQGAASDAEIGTFLGGAQRIAQQFDGEAVVPDAAGMLAHAQALDGFCAGVDVQLAVNVIETAGESFAGTKLRGLAEAAGLVLEEDGRFHARDDDGAEVFALGNLGPELFTADSLKVMAAVGVSFVLDVPRVADGPAAFDRMVAAARQMALALGGTVVDGQRHTLTDAMIAGIREKVGEIQRQMTANQIPPGGARALRLFS